MSKILPAFKGFKFGADPELFLFGPDGRPASPDMIPGTKEEPYKVPNGAVQRDGMAAEFNIDPAESFEEFNDNIVSVMKSLRGMIPKGYTLQAVPFVRFDPDVFDAAPYEAKMLGCSPDFNAWTGDINPPPDVSADPYARCAAGHVHIGWTEDAEITVQHAQNGYDLVKQLDWYLGAWSIKHDPDPQRRKLYGKAGACRIKPYGVEYRVLSNFWVTSRDHRLTVWNRMQTALGDMRTRYMPGMNTAADSLLVDSINSSILPPLLEAEYRNPITRLAA